MIGCPLAWKFNCIKPYFLQSVKVALFPGLHTVQFLIACTHMMGTFLPRMWIGTGTNAMQKCSENLWKDFT